LIFLLILGFTPLFPLAAAAFFLRGGLMNMSIPLYSSFCMEKTAEQKRGVASSVIQMAWQGGWAVGPFVSGFVQERWGFPPLFVVTGLLYAAAVALIGKFLLPVERGESPVVASVG
jgi:predicted MFS family arabinose efflux permease